MEVPGPPVPPLGEAIPVARPSRIFNRLAKVAGATSSSPTGLQSCAFALARSAPCGPANTYSWVHPCDGPGARGGRERPDIVVRPRGAALVVPADVVRVEPPEPTLPAPTHHIASQPTATAHARTHLSDPTTRPRSLRGALDPRTACRTARRTLHPPASPSVLSSRCRNTQLG